VKATIENVAYIIFFSSFSVWVGILFATLAITNSLIFTNVLMSTAFLVSGTTAAASCGIVGLSFLGISLNLKSKQALKQEEVVDVIVEGPSQLAPKKQNGTRVKVERVPTLEISAVNILTIEETQQLKPKVQKRKKPKGPKAPNLEVSIITDNISQQQAQLTPKVQRRKKAKATKQPNLEITVMGLPEEELKQKT
jgi:hypothetical protein